LDIGNVWSGVAAWKSRIRASLQCGPDEPSLQHVAPAAGLRSTTSTKPNLDLPQEAGTNRRVLTVLR
jgi:hypothetical protein